jgi:HEAT repeat protein
MKSIGVSAFVLALTASISAQQAARQAEPQDQSTVLGRGWTALGTQQPAKAIELAQQLLRADPGNHNALALAVAALAASRQPMQGLDAYEKWIAASRHEDIFLLQPIARGLLRELTESKEPRVRFLALAALAEAGDGAAQKQLQDAVTDQGAPTEIDAALAASGDQAAIRRLEAQITAGGPRDKSAAIDALAKADAQGSRQALIAALKDPAPPSRMAAANALAELDATDAIPALKAALQEPDPAVRNMIGVALARLGDSSGGVTLASLENSPLGDLRLIAAGAAAKQNPQGAWAEKVRTLLSDPDPLLRLRAASLLMEHDRDTDAAEATLVAGLSDDTPAVRTEAVRALREISRRRPAAQDPTSLRRLLRDRVPDVRIEAAAAILGPRG